MTPSLFRQSLAWLVLTRMAAADYTPIIDSLSFGHQGHLSSSDDGAIAGWHLNSVNHKVQVMSDRVVLTPPVPGNARGSMWSDKATSSQDWTAQLEFRASGQEMGSGNLQLWYTSSRDSVVTSSVYNAEKFDGLVLVIDQYGRSGGKIRGFLNDGGVDFRSTMNLESLAFGHCDYNYRNLGRPSKLRVSHQGGLTVTVDDKTCFSSDKISLPAGYYFGITATTGEDPDSFELQKFIVTAGGQPVSAPSPTQQTQQQQQPPHTQKMDKMPGAPEFIPDRDADQIKSTSDQFADVHNRLQALSHHMGTLYYEFKEMSDKIDAKHTEVVSLVNNIKGSKDTGLPPDTVGKISTMNDRVTNIEALVNLVKQDIEGKDYKENLDELHRAMSFLHHNFHTKLDDKMEFAIKTHTPTYTSMIFVILGFQMLMAFAYVMYKRQRHSGGKKYL